MINREYKDRLFSFIFGREENREWTLSLYNAVNGSSYPDPAEIEFNTIDSILYLGMHNDLSFIIRYDMNLYAHQSTFNPNMPLRELMYLGQLYSKYVTQNKLNIYGRTRVRIPMPKIMVFYNGKEDADDETILELKDSFYEGADASKSDVAVRVRMLNIHSDRNRAIMERCRPLYEYAAFTDNVYKYRESMEIESAVNQALDEMPDDWLIKGFLSANRAEVVEMCLTEYNEEETMEMFKEEGRKEGRAEGRDEGVQAVVKTCKTLGASSHDAAENLISTMGYSENEANELVAKYW